MYKKAILHLDLDAFFVSVELLRNTALKGKPVIIGGGSRGVVASCSYQARAYGVHSAMPIKTALQRCPDAIVLRGDMEAYTQHSEIITNIIAEEAPLYEKASIDEFYLDLTGMDRHFGCWKWSEQLRKKIIRESGLDISMGLSVNKLISKISTGEAKPNGAKMIEAGTEKEFIAPMPVHKLPSVGKETHRKLVLMGVRNIHTLSCIPPILLEKSFGKHGIEMWKRAHAIDERPVVPYHEKQSISTEKTFSEDTTDIDFITAQLISMCSNLAYELRQSDKLTSCVTVKIRYTDFNTFSKQQKIPYTAIDHTLISLVKNLFHQLYQRRQLIRLIGIRFSGLVHGKPQMSLFDQQAESEKLLQAMDRIRNRFGMKAITKAFLLDKP